MYSNAKPLVLFFIEKGCPVAHDAAPFLDELQTAYGQAVTVVGMINADADAAKAWADGAGVQFAIIPDPTQAIISTFAARRGGYVTLVAPGGKTVTTYPGYSATMLRELSTTIASLAGVAARHLPFTGAPDHVRAGCEFMRPPQSSPVAAATASAGWDRT